MAKKVQRRTFEGFFFVGSDRQRAKYVIIFSIFPTTGNGTGWFRPDKLHDVTRFTAPRSAKLRSQELAFVWLRKTLSQKLGCQPQDIQFGDWRGRLKDFEDTSFIE